MPKSNPTNKNAINQPNAPIHYRQVAAGHGKIWLSQAMALFKSSIAAWFAIVAFIFFLLTLPIALLLPVGIGGLMMGCHQSSQNSPIKFEHLFAGIKSDSKELMMLSFIYAIGSLAVMFLSYIILLAIGVDFKAIIPSNAEQMTSIELANWFASLNQAMLYSTLALALLVALALAIPLLMAYWFAPALIVINKIPATSALKLSFMACKDNFLPFLIYGLLFFGYLFLFNLVISLLMFFIPILAILTSLIGVFVIFAVTLSSIYTSYADVFIQPETASTLDHNNHSDSNGASMLA